MDIAQAVADRRVADAPRAALAPAEPTEGALLLLAIQRATSAERCDLDQVKELWALHREMKAETARVAYDAAFARMQPELPIIDENGEVIGRDGGVASTYAEWENINEAIKPILARFGFGLSFRTGRTADDDRIPTITAIVSHDQGHRETTTMELPEDASGDMNDLQAVGSSTSYMKRYTALAILNIVSRRREDDDGRAGGVRHSPAVRDALRAIDLCQTVDDVTRWNAANEPTIGGLSHGEQQAVIRHSNDRKRTLREEATRG
jgi:hypothetical protein